MLYKIRGAVEKVEQGIMELTKNIAEQHPHFAYIFFFLSAVLQILFPPYPGDTVLLLEGYLSSKGLFNMYAIVIIAVTATCLSSILLYHISYRMGKRIFSTPFVNTYFSKDRVIKLYKWFRIYGSFAVFLCKFVPGIGSLAVIAAGAFRVPKVKVYGAMTAGAVIHNVSLVLIGSTTGNNMKLIKELFRKYNMLIIAAALIAVSVYGCYKYFRKSKEPGREG